MREIPEKSTIALSLESRVIPSFQQLVTQYD